MQEMWSRGRFLLSAVWTSWLLLLLPLHMNAGVDE